MFIRNILCCFIFSLLFSSCIQIDQMGQTKKDVKKESILFLEISGIITSELSEKFMASVRKYASKPKVKGVLVRVNSPGGTVSASQEINSAIRDIRDLYKKPVFISGGDLVASGAVYSVVSADKIFVNNGTAFGSIGVLMEFRNYSELIKWAKMDIFHLKAGEFKDSGSPYRKMTLRERELFENLMEDTLDQFKSAIAQGRNLSAKAVESFSDGRVFSGAEALEIGLVDGIGSFNHVLRAIGEKTGLGSDPDLFDPNKKSAYEQFFEGFSDGFSGKTHLFSRLFSMFDNFEKISGQPLYILPSYLSPQ